MFVKMLQSVSTRNGSWGPGRVAKLDDKTGKAFVKAGVAREATKEEQTAQADCKKERTAAHTRSYTRYSESRQKERDATVKKKKDRQEAAVKAHEELKKRIAANKKKDDKKRAEALERIKKQQVKGGEGHRRPMTEKQQAKADAVTVEKPRTRGRRTKAD